VAPSPLDDPAIFSGGVTTVWTPVSVPDGGSSAKAWQSLDVAETPETNLALESVPRLGESGRGVEEDSTGDTAPPLLTLSLLP
jgi:hypothetical protein